MTTDGLTLRTQYRVAHTDILGIDGNLLVHHMNPSAVIPINRPDPLLTPEEKTRIAAHAISLWERWRDARSGTPPGESE